MYDLLLLCTYYYNNLDYSLSQFVFICIYLYILNIHFSQKCLRPIFNIPNTLYYDYLKLNILKLNYYIKLRINMYYKI